MRLTFHDFPAIARVMKTQRQNGALRVADVTELKEAGARRFRDEIHAWLAPDLQCIEMDLSQTSEVDSCGVAALVSIYEAANKGRACPLTIRLLHPQPIVQQVLELTRLHHLFEIVPQDRENSPSELECQPFAEEGVTQAETFTDLTS